VDDTLRSKPPSERAEIIAAAEAKARKLAQARSSEMREDFTRTFQTEHGKRTLAALYQRSGFGQVILAADGKTGQIDPMLTTFAAMELNNYIFIRNLLPIELVQEIEDVRRIQPSGSTIDPSTGSGTERRTSRGTRKRTRS